ncbi:MAG: histidine kinase, partial [Pseudomonadota bacterium]
MHRLLARQIKRHLGDPAELPAALATFIAAVDDAYDNADADRLLIERSLDLMSKELTEANDGLRKELAEHRRIEQVLQKKQEEQHILIRKLEDVHSQLLQSEKMASIGQLAAGVAHEINNPIGYVYSNLGTLEKYVQDTFGMLE